MLQILSTTVRAALACIKELVSIRKIRKMDLFVSAAMMRELHTRVIVATKVLLLKLCCERIVTMAVDRVSFLNTVVVVIAFPPVFTTEPARQVVDLDTEVTLHCEAQGEPRPVISWYKDKVMLENEHENTLVFEVQLDDRGNYSCVAKNALGRIESPPALVNVGGK